MDGQYCGEPEHHRQTYLDRIKHADLLGHLDQVPSILILTQRPALPCLTHPCCIHGTVSEWDCLACPEIHFLHPASMYVKSLRDASPRVRRGRVLWLVSEAREHIRIQ